MPPKKPVGSAPKASPPRTSMQSAGRAGGGGGGASAGPKVNGAAGGGGASVGPKVNRAATATKPNGTTTTATQPKVNGKTTLPKVTDSNSKRMLQKDAPTSGTATPTQSKSTTASTLPKIPENVKSSNPSPKTEKIASTSENPNAGNEAEEEEETATGAAAQPEGSASVVVANIDASETSGEPPSQNETIPTESQPGSTSVPEPGPQPEAQPEQPPEPVEEICGDGEVKLLYEMYDEDFPVTAGSTTAAEIDDVYCLSFVMPGCLIHLSKYSPAEYRKMQDENEFVDIFIKEEPRGTYHGLKAGEKYYVHIEQEAEQLKRDQERMKQVAARMDGAAQPKGDVLVKDDGRGMESCSCIYGNPCVDEYGCKDWSNRFAIATKNGWKGF